MNNLQTSINGLTLSRPDPERDAPFALAWFASPDGKDTLLRMGNPEHAIGKPSLQEETDRIRDFLTLEKDGKQLTWMMRYDNRTIGAVWLELCDTDRVKAPAFHIMIGDKQYRGRGFGAAVMREMIRYATDTLCSDFLYSRHLTSNATIAHLNDAFGFVKDGAPYTDSDGLEFQNVKVRL